MRRMAMSQRDLFGAQPVPLDALQTALIDYCIAHRVPAALPDTIEAGDAWGANCGPMALAAVLGLPTVEAARPLVQPFRGFMSPTDMRKAVSAAGRLVSLGTIGECDPDPWPTFGLARIQWIGPWCSAGVDPRAAYRYTHWIAVRRPTDIRSMDWFLCRDAAVRAEQAGLAPEPEVMIYDATPNRWVPLERWAAWCPVLWPKRTTGWRVANTIEVSAPR